MSDSFFSRWSQRKTEVRHGRPVADPPPPPPASARPVPPREATPAAVSAPATAPREVTEAPPPPPTLAEAQALTPEADFTRFVRQGVPTEVKNTAFKKLFADPHFNVMDGLDIYIEDYGRPDPLPLAMARQLASAQFMGLFDDEPEAQADKLSAPAVAQLPAVPQSPAPATEITPTETPRQDASEAPPALPATQPPHHEHADLLLQPDPAPGRPSPGGGAG